MGSVDIPSPRYLGTLGKSLTLRFFHCQSESYKAVAASNRLHGKCLAGNASFMVCSPNYQLSSFSSSEGVLFPFRRSQGNDKDRSPNASYFWLKHLPPFTQRLGSLLQRSHPPSLPGQRWGSMPSFKAGTLVRSILL